MNLLDYKPFLLMLGLASVYAEQNYMDLTPGLIRKSEGLCQAMAQEPFFSLEMVVGKSWRIYFTWNMKMEDRCVDIHFKVPTPEIIRRISYDTSAFLSKQPNWEAATLLMTLGKNRQEILLIPDMGIPGRFLGVANDVNNMVPGNQHIPILRFQMKLFYDRGFLFFMDCLVGVASLASESKKPPFRMQIEAVAREMSLYLDDGFHACVNDKNPEENVVKPNEDK